MSETWSGSRNTAASRRFARSTPSTSSATESGGYRRTKARSASSPARSGEAPDYLKPVLRLYASTGMRRNELVELLFSDIDFDRRCITVRASKSKSKKPREILVDDDTLAMLAELQEKAGGRKPVEGHQDAFSRQHVFVTAINTPLRNNLLRAFYAVCKRAGIAGGEQGGSVGRSLRCRWTTELTRKPCRRSSVIPR